MLVKPESVKILDLTPSLEYSYPPMMLRLPPNTPELDRKSRDADYVAEVKKNGWRAPIYMENDQCILWSRHGHPIKAQFDNPQIISLREHLLEVFGHLQPLKLDAELLHFRLAEEQGRIYIFDVVTWQGDHLGDYLNLDDRRAPLFDMGFPDVRLVHKIEDRIFVPGVVEVGFQHLYDEVIQDPTVEGLVLRNRSREYPFYNKKIKCPWMFKVKRPDPHTLSDNPP